MNAEALAHCLADTTFTTYASGWKSWLHCAEFYGNSFYTDCILPDRHRTPLSLSECVLQLDLYIGYECGLRQIKPSSIADTYLSAIAKAFDIRGIKNNFRAAANDPRTKTLLAGYANIWARKHPAHEIIKIPFTLVLALQSEIFLKSGDIKFSNFVTSGTSPRAILDVMRLTCALFFGIFFLLRKGEFLPKSASTCHRPMRRSDLRFLDADQRVIPYHLVGHTRASWLTITIVFSKTDQTGRGRIVTHHIDVANPLQCVVQRMEAYVMFARDWFGAQSHDILFEVPGCPSLTASIITQLMREVCRLLGLPYTKVSAHSLRYGGATTLAAARFPEYVIAFYGGWSPTSKAMRTYIKPTNDVIRKVSLQMTRAQSSVAVQQHVNQLLATRIVVDL